ncbi:MAG: hypothetical protein HUU04_07280 [Verrucomicrobiae bacterium]|nr:hypothetical protein [Verrucomicrobiae bacterium]
MKRLPLAAAALAAGIAFLVIARVGAQDASPADKWTQIAENHKKMTAALEAIEQNLNFVKARSMSGGRHN